MPALGVDAARCACGSHHPGRLFPLMSHEPTERGVLHQVGATGRWKEAGGPACPQMQACQCQRHRRAKRTELRGRPQGFRRGSLELGQRTGISDEFSDDAEAAGVATTFQNQGLRTQTLPATCAHHTEEGGENPLRAQGVADSDAGQDERRLRRSLPNRSD